MCFSFLFFGNLTRRMLITSASLTLVNSPDAGASKSGPKISFSATHRLEPKSRNSLAVIVRHTIELILCPVICCKSEAGQGASAKDDRFSWRMQISMMPNQPVSFFSPILIPKFILLH